MGFVNGFSQQIKVHLGSLWTGGGYGLEAYAGGPEKITGLVAGPGGPLTTHPTPNTIVLTQIGGFDNWSEDGTFTPNSVSNRMVFAPRGGGPGSAKRAGFAGVTLGAGNGFAPGNSVQAYGGPYYYTYNMYELYNMATTPIAASSYNFFANATASTGYRVASLNSANYIYSFGISGPAAGGLYRQVFELLENYTPPSPPSKATSPTPSNGAKDISLGQTLSWVDGGGATSYDVYFGTNPSSLSFIGNQPGTTYDPGGLDALTDYYWRIDAKNAGGTTTGDAWSFRTVREGDKTTYRYG